MKNVLIINAGSSSLKFKLFDHKKNIISSGTFKNHKENEYSFEIDQQSTKQLIKQRDFEYPIEFLFDFLIQNKIIDSLETIDSIGHRIVHGGEEFTGPTELTKQNIEKIKKYNEFAPLHNPPALKIIEQLASDYQNIKQIGVFDTSFHLTNQKDEFLYGLPYGYYENLGIRRFGFHGISYEYIINHLQKVTPQLKDKKLIICHLGSGSSVCGVKDSKSITHSFGFTPNENLMMATRSGEVDYDAINYLKNKLDMSDKDVEILLNKESGLLGVSGYTKDMKTLVNDYHENQRAKLAVNIYINYIVKYIAQTYLKLQGCDALIFTGGIGCGSDKIRELVLKQLEILHIYTDFQKNDGMVDVNEDTDVTAPESRTKVLTIPTNEELQILHHILKH